MRKLFLSKFYDGWNNFSSYTQAADDVVQDDVVGNLAEDRSQRSRDATSSRFGELRDRLDLAAQIAACHGPPGT